MSELDTRPAWMQNPNKVMTAQDIQEMIEYERFQKETHEGRIFELEQAMEVMGDAAAKSLSEYLEE